MTNDELELEPIVAVWLGGPEDGQAMMLAPGTQELRVMVHSGPPTDPAHEVRTCPVVPGGPTGWVIRWQA